MVRLTSVEEIFNTGGEASRTNDTTLTFKTNEAYSGPGSIVFGVVDDIEDDTLRRKAVISVPIEVTPSDSRRDGKGNSGEMLNSPPEGPDTTVFTVGAGEPEQPFHLDGLYTDPEGSTVSFGDWKLVSDSSEGRVAYRFGAGEATIFGAAAINAPKGTGLLLEGKAYDASQGYKVIRVQVLGGSSTRPLTTTVSDEIEDANAGQTVTLNVLENDKSHLDNTQLTLLSAKSSSGDGVEVKSENQVVSVTTPEGYRGYVEGSYQVGDATEDPDRVVSGTFRVFVRSAPDKPSTPVKESVGDREVTISWESGYNGGTPVTKYLVTARTEDVNAGSVVTLECETNTCTIPGLENAINWFFTVVEVNEAGQSESSNESAAIMPDVVPKRSDPPISYVTDHTDRSITLRWKKPDNEGTKITEYYIRRDDNESDPIAVDVAEAVDPDHPGWYRYEWTRGVEIGKHYKFAITSKNGAGIQEYWSDYSKEVWASKVPGKPTIVSVKNSSDSNQGDKFDVTFNAPADYGGDDITKYKVTVKNTADPNDVQEREFFEGSTNSSVVNHSGDQLYVTIGKTTKNQTYDFTVQAANRDGYGEPAVLSGVTSKGAPDKPDTVKLTPKDSGFTIDEISWENGANQPYDEVQVEAYAAGRKAKSYKLEGKAPYSKLFDGLENGTSYDIQIILCSLGRCADEAYDADGLIPVSAIIPAPNEITDTGTAISYKELEVSVSLDDFSPSRYGGHDPKNLSLGYSVGTNCSATLAGDDAANSGKLTRDKKNMKIRVVFNDNAGSCELRYWFEDGVGTAHAERKTEVYKPIHVFMTHEGVGFYEWGIAINSDALYGTLNGGKVECTIISPQLSDGSSLSREILKNAQMVPYRNTVGIAMPETSETLGQHSITVNCAIKDRPERKEFKFKSMTVSATG